LKGLLRAINERVEAASLTLTAVLLVLMTAVVFLEVIARYVFWYSFVWSEEVALSCFQWITFLGGAVALRRGQHFVVDLFPELKGSSLAGRLRCCAIHVAEFVFVLVLAVYGTQFAVLSLKRHSYALGIPIVHETSAIPLGGAAMVLFTLESIVSCTVRKAS
jgi:TRAP-type C4-dicarboxylate transport system permease small subunit